MIWQLLLLFIVVPFVELALLLKVADATSWQLTLLLVIITGVVGTLLARSQGVRTYQAIQRSLAAGRMPGDAVLDAVLIFMAGAVLLTPGILTDLLGFALLIPFSRRYIRGGLIRWFKARFNIQSSFATGGQAAERSEVIDSYVVEKDSDDSRP